MLTSAELEMLIATNLDEWKEALRDACTITDALCLLQAEVTSPTHLIYTHKAKLQAAVRSIIRKSIPDNIRGEQPVGCLKEPPPYFNERTSTHTAMNKLIASWRWRHVPQNWIHTNPSPIHQRILWQTSRPQTADVGSQLPQYYLRNYISPVCGQCLGREPPVQRRYPGYTPHGTAQHPAHTWGYTDRGESPKWRRTTKGSINTVPPTPQEDVNAAAAAAGNICVNRLLYISLAPSKRKLAIMPTPRDTKKTKTPVENATESTGTSAMFCLYPATSPSYITKPPTSIRPLAERDTISMENGDISAQQKYQLVWWLRREFNFTSRH